MADYTYVKGFRTQAAYFPETAFGTYSITNYRAKKIGGKVRSINWTVRQNILQTGNVGDGRNYKQQMYGTYDASASIAWEVIEPSFLRFAMGDIAAWGDSGVATTTPFFFVESEMTGIDGLATGTVGTTTSTNPNTNLLLQEDASGDFGTAHYRKIRIRPFSMLLYDLENTSASVGDWNESVDMLKGCSLNDFSLSASIGSPLLCNSNVIVKEISFRRNLTTDAATLEPDWTAAIGDLADADKQADLGNAKYDDFAPVDSHNMAQQAPLMFYNGTIEYGSGNVIGKVQSFTYNYNNGLNSFREVGDRFILQPTVGMRGQSLTMNILFSLPPGDDGTGLGGGVAAGSVTTILEIIKNYFGYDDTTPYTFATGSELRPALATNTTTTSPQRNAPIEKSLIQLTFNGYNLSGSGTAERGMEINIRNATPEGFGHPVVLENGLVEIPITFSVRGYPFSRVSDGSYGGHDGAGDALADYNPILKWWFTKIS